MGFVDRLRPRERLAKARMYCERQAIASFGPHHAKPHGRLLCYHSVGQPDLGVNDCSPSRFRRHIDLARQLGFRFVPAAQIAGGGGLPATLQLLSMTVGRAFLPWRHQSLTSTKSRPLCSWQPAWSRARLRGIGHACSTGKNLANSTRWAWRLAAIPSRIRTLGSIDKPRAVDELNGSREALKSRLGINPDCFAIPFGQSRNWTSVAHDAAGEAGYRFIYAQAENTRPPGTIPRTFVTWMDDDRIFTALLKGAFDNWEEWY